MRSFVGMYTHEVYKCKQCGDVLEVNTTSHADKQWRDRSRMAHTDPMDAWGEAVEIYNHDFDAEIAQYHHPSRIALLQKGASIVTCIYIPTARYEGQRAALQAMIRVGADNGKIANLTNECRITRSGLEEIVKHMNRPDRGDGSAEPTAGSARTNTPGRTRS